MRVSKTLGEDSHILCLHNFSILSEMWYHYLNQLASKHSAYLKRRFEINSQIHVVKQDTNSASLS